MTPQYRKLLQSSLLCPLNYEKLEEMIPESFKSLDNLISSWQRFYDFEFLCQKPSGFFNSGSAAMREMQETLSRLFKLAGLVPLNEHLAVLEKAESLKKQSESRKDRDKKIQEKLFKLSAMLETHKQELDKQNKVIESQKKAIAEKDKTIQGLEAARDKEKVEPANPE